MKEKYASSKYPALTIRQAQVFEFCCDYIVANDNFPLIKVIGYEVGVSPTQATNHVEAICKAGYFERHGRTYKRSDLGILMRAKA